MAQTKLEVGQKIYFEEKNYRGQIQEELLEGVINKIGKKYFTVEGESKLSSRKFHIDTLVEEAGNYSPTLRGFVSKYDYLDQRELVRGVEEIRKLIGQYGDTTLNLGEVRAILFILKGNK